MSQFNTAKMMKALEKGEVPRAYPRECCSDYYDSPQTVEQDELICMAMGISTPQQVIRRQHGMYGLVTKELCKQLASWINGGKVLEIMAGCGWLSKGLTEAGCDVISTDNFSWHKNRSREGQWKLVHPVKKLGAIAAVRKYRDVCDVLAVSWPYFRDWNHVKAMREWPKGKRVLYIGENAGGCCAREEFFELVKFDKKIWEYYTFPFLHDTVWTGKRR